jgi:hypothetical protein
MYYLSVLSIFKNETINLKLWLEHYIWQGVEHFYLIDNGSTDEPLSILQEYINNGIVSYFYLPKKHNQVNYYQNIFDNEELNKKTLWLAICDLDEFFFGVDQILASKIKSLENNFDYILCNWKMFGSGGHIKQPTDIRTDIIHCAEKLWNETKYIFKTNIIKHSSSISLHSLININHITKQRIRRANQLIRLNHYAIQSLDFFKKVKMTRGAADCSKYENIRDISYFNKYDFKETTDETLKNIILNKQT